MAKSISDQFEKRIQQRLAKAFRELPAVLGEEAVNFSLESFDKEAWSGASQEVWLKRKNPTKWGKKDEVGRNLLIKTGRGRRTIRVSRVVENKAFIVAGGPEAPYMKVHNNGFRGAVDQQVKPFTRRMRNGNTQQVSGFTRTIHQNIPQRRFIGGAKDSPYLRARLRRVTMAIIKKTIKE